MSLGNGTGAMGSGHSSESLESLGDVNQLENVRFIGGDSIMGRTDASIHHLEVTKKEKFILHICLLHTHEFLFLHLMRDQGMETSWANSFTGELGHLIKEEVHLYEVNGNLEIMNFGGKY